MPMYKQYDIPVLTNDPNGICEDQTTGAAGALTLDGALVSGGIATAAAGQIVSIEGTGDNSGITFTITGLNSEGNTVPQVVTGENNGTAKSTTYFKTIDSIVASGAVTGNVEAGWLAADGMAGGALPLNLYQTPFNISLFFDLTAGTMTLSAQYTADDPFATYASGFATEAKWWEVTGLSAVTADAVSNIAFPVRAVRFVQTIGSATGTATVTAIQGDTGA